MNLKYYFFNCLITILSITTLSNSSVFAQAAPTFGWSNKYGTAKTDAFHCIIEKNFGELIAVGTTGAKRNKNILFARIDPATGELIDTPTVLGGSDNDFAYRIIQTKEDGYVIVGASKGKVQKAFILQVDSKGKQIWIKHFRPSLNAVFYDVVQNREGDLYVTGQVGLQACLLKYTSTGTLVWDKTFNTDGEAAGLAIKLIEGKDIVLATYQKKGKQHSTLLQRIDANSITVWQQEFSDIKVKDLWIDADKIAATGTLFSPKKQRIEDLFLLTVTLDGQELNRSDLIRNRGKDSGNALLKSRDGFYYTAGYSDSFATNHNFPKSWVSKMNEAGKEVYPDYYLAGGKSTDEANDILELEDGSLIIAGQSRSAAISYTIAGQSQSIVTSPKKGAWLMKLLRADYVEEVARYQAQVSVPDKLEEAKEPEETKEPKDSKPPIIITWLNDLKEKKVYQPISMELRAISDGPLKDVHFTVALNDAEEIELTKSVARSNPVLIGQQKKRNYEIDFDPMQPFLREGPNIIRIKGDGKLLREFLIDYLPAMPNLYLVSIGIPYGDDLNYTSKDAKDFANLFASPNSLDSLFKKIDIDTLISAAATEATVIERKMFDLKGEDVKSNDYILIFISAHGLIYENEFYIPASNYEGENVGAVNFNENFIKRLKGLNCKKLIFIDACNSGKGGKGPVISNTAEALIKITEAANDFYIMTSSSAKQKSYENKEWENGAFTKALEEAFTNKKVDIGEGSPIQANTNDAYLTLAELFKFIEPRVEFLAQSKNLEQTPTINKNLSKLHVPIFYSGTK